MGNSAAAVRKELAV
ncbi:hypothetical protein [Bradyrhizobium genosp. A]